MNGSGGAPLEKQSSMGIMQGLPKSSSCEEGGEPYSVSNPVYAAAQRSRSGRSFHSHV